MACLIDMARAVVDSVAAGVRHVTEQGNDE
jgi:hypothetical protein